MIKVEQDMLVLDATLSKQDAQAINEFMAIVEQRTKKSIIDIIRKVEYHGMTHSENCLDRHYMAEDIIEAIGE